MTAATKVAIRSHPDRRFRTGMVGQEEIDVRALETELRATVEGEVRFDTQSRALYATDASNFRQVPIGVVVPRTLDDVVATTTICHRHRAPLVNRGGGTSLSGETVNVAVVVDFSKYLTGIGAVDPEAHQVTAELGVINEQLNLAIGHTGWIFGPDPSTHSRCTLGGNVGNNSCGVHSVQSHLHGPGPRTSDNVSALEVLTYDGERFWVGVDEEDDLDRIIAAGGRKGEIYARLRSLRDRYADDIRAGYPSVDELPRRVSGYNLDELLPENGFNVARALVGTESTCVTALRGTFLLTPALLQRTTVIVQYDDVAAAAADVPDVLEWKPIGLEALDHLLIEDQQELDMHLEGLHELPRRGGTSAWLLVQFGFDDAEESIAHAERFIAHLRDDLGYDDDRMVVSKSVQEGGNSELLWQVREGGLGSTAFPPDGRDHWPGWEDSAVPPARLSEYLVELQKLYDHHGLRGAMYGHFGEGCVHSRISFDLRSARGLATYRAFLTDAARLVTSCGGSLSGEHGDGQQRAELLEIQYGPSLMEAMREFKEIWDPDWKMNPGKVIEPYRFDENLRLGTDSNPWRPATRLSYPEDHHDFAHATLRCVGIGKCRQPDARTTMCPSYQVTREETHSTRGRARLLSEMLEGDVITDGWQSNEVADSLDLCLACKGCTSDCPVEVDMPRYKAEFRYHHYKSWRRWRHRHAFAFGFIDRWAQIAAHVPELVDFVTRTPGLRSLVRLAAGIDQQRELPRFAPLTLQQWFARRGGTKNPDGRRVVVFPDTFNNHLSTEVGVACVEAIEAAGWQVVMPSGHVCCGRPLYDYGFLDAAERYLRRVIDVLRDDIRADTPIVGMEPSCLAVFKDELPHLLPHDDDATRLTRNAHHFAEFFAAYDIDVPTFAGDALYWGHCHQRATGGAEPGRDLLARMGASTELLTGGCCGLAGSWGFESGKYDLSAACGEQALLPAVRAAPTDTAIVADGFSCRTQIEQLAGGRRALHSAQMLQLARELGPNGCRGGPPEQADIADRPHARPGRRVVRTAVPVGIVLGAIGLAAARAGRMYRR